MHSNTIAFSVALLATLLLKAVSWYYQECVTFSVQFFFESENEGVKECINVTCYCLSLCLRSLFSTWAPSCFCRVEAPPHTV